MQKAPHFFLVTADSPLALLLIDYLRVPLLCDKYVNPFSVISTASAFPESHQTKEIQNNSIKHV